MDRQTILQNVAWKIWGILLVLTLFGISVRNAEAKSRQITYRLKWIENMSTVGDLYAQQQGYFKTKGLAVTIKPGGPERDAIRELELGHTDFGVASADQVIRALAKGAPIVVVAQLFQINPLQWIYRQDRNTLGSLKDLKGKTIGVTFGKNDEMILRTLLAQAQLDEPAVRLYGVRLDYAPFYQGRVDFWPVYINTQGVEIGGRLRAAGETVGFLNPTDYGVRFVANSVVTSQKVLTQQPAMVKQFVQALLKGWHEAVDPANNDTAIQVVQAVDRDSTLAVLKQQLELTRKLIQPSPQTIVGAIDQKGWRQTEKIMLDYHQIAKPVNVMQSVKFMGQAR